MTASDPEQNVCSLAVDFRVYLVTDRKITKKPLLDAVRDALEGGVKAVQLREKDLSARELLPLARDLREMTIDFGAKLFINDQVDVAMSVAADGVHLGRQSMPVAATRRVAGPKMLIGVSTHSAEEVAAAQQEGADFAVLGPIYATPSKMAYGAPIGLDPLRMAKRKTDIPLFAIGGIKGRNIGHVLWAGAYGVAMISGILGAEDIRRAAKNTTEMITIVDRSICVQCGRR